jgi:hypothetical protein
MQDESAWEYATFDKKEDAPNEFLTQTNQGSNKLAFT